MQQSAGALVDGRLIAALDGYRQRPGTARLRCPGIGVVFGSGRPIAGGPRSGPAAADAAPSGGAGRDGRRQARRAQRCGLQATG